MRHEIPAVGPAYTNREKGLSAQVTKNLFPEVNPEARNIVALHNTPGLKPFAELTGKDRGTHVFNNVLYAVSGKRLHKIEVDGTDTDLGAIIGDNRCVFSDDGKKLIVVNGENKGYIYTDADGLSVITDPDLIDPLSSAYINSTFVFDNNGGSRGEFITSDIANEFNVKALSFATAEAHPDDIVRVFTFQQLLYLFGSKSIEAWINTGEGTPPFQRAGQGVLAYGLMGTHAVTSTPDHIYFLDDQRIPRKMLGYSVQNIGIPPLGVEWASYTTLSDAIVFQYVQDNQRFIVFTFPTEDRTWVYHEDSNSWFQWSYGVDNARSRASSCQHVYGLNFCADHTNGKIYQLDPCTHTDNGEPIQRQRDTATIHGGLWDAPGATMHFDSVEFLIRRGPCEIGGSERVESDLTPAPAGICGTAADLNQGALLPPTPLMINEDLAHQLTYVTADTDSNDLADSQKLSFTTAFCRESGTEPSAGDGWRAQPIAVLWEIYQSNTSFSSVGQNLACYMDANGDIVVKGRNVTGETILDCTITNNSVSLADDTTHMLAVVIDLSDTTKREVWLDKINITDNTSYCTWTTYEDDYLRLGTSDPAATADTIQYNIGGSVWATSTWAERTPQDAWAGGLTSFGFVTIDNDCTLIPTAVWDDNNYVLDPQGDFTGWYLTQPKMGWSSSLWSNGGSLDIINDYVFLYGGATGAGLDQQLLASHVNSGAAGTVDGTGTGDYLPPGTDDTTTEIVSPYYDNMDGDWVDLNSIAKTSFSAVFGVTADGANFTSNFTVNKAMLFNASQSGVSIQVVPSNYATQVALIVCELDGDVVAKSSYSPTSGVASVVLPSGGDYYLIVYTDTGTVKIKKWLDTATSTFQGHTATFAEIFGEDQKDALLRLQYYVYTSRHGLAFPIYLPEGKNISIANIDGPNTRNAVLEYSVSDNPGDYTTAHALGHGVGSVNIQHTTGAIVSVGAGAQLPAGWYWYSTRVLNYASVTKPVSVEIYCHQYPQ